MRADGEQERFYWDRFRSWAISMWWAWTRSDAALAIRWRKSRRPRRIEEVLKALGQATTRASRRGGGIAGIGAEIRRAGRSDDYVAGGAEVVQHGDPDATHERGRGGDTVHEARDRAGSEFRGGLCSTGGAVQQPGASEEKPGLGVKLNEEVARRYPPRANLFFEWRHVTPRAGAVG